MTPEEYRKLDYEVAEKVMGWTNIRHASFPRSRVIGTTDTGEENWEIPYFSTDIGDAWEIVEKLGMTVGKYNDHWFAGVGDIEDTGTISAPTAPLVICLAALKGQYGTG